MASSGNELVDLRTGEVTPARPAEVLARREVTPASVDVAQKLERRRDSLLRALATITGSAGRHATGEMALAVRADLAIVEQTMREQGIEPSHPLATRNSVIA